MKILLAGGSGYLGKLLQNAYSINNEVYVLTRGKSKQEGNITFLHWDGKTLDDTWGKVLLSSDIVINLAGRTVDCRYNDKNKKQIFDSRTFPTELIGKLLSENENNVKTWINLSSANEE